MSASPNGNRVLKLLEALPAYAAPRKTIDAMVVTALPNIRYLTGFTGSNAILLASHGATTLFTDPRYSLQAAKEVSCSVRVLQGPLLAGVTDFVKRRKFKRLGVERNRISFETWDGLHSGLPAGTELVPVACAVEDLRMLKTPEEIALIRNSVETNSRALRRALKSFRPGMRETELAAEIDYQSRRAGAETPAFETIVCSGPRSAFPHARPTISKIADKTMLLIDMGAMESGYASDMTRTMFVGSAPKRFKTLYKAVLESQLAAIDAVKPGVTAGAVDKIARAVLDAHGLGKEFVHSTGHGLGLEIHESPRLGKKSTTPLQSGFAVTVEPGVYIDGYGGIRIEDTVVVTDSGCDVLTPTPKDLVEW